MQPSSDDSNYWVIMQYYVSMVYFTTDRICKSFLNKPLCTNLYTFVLRNLCFLSHKIAFTRFRNSD